MKKLIIICIYILSTSVFSQSTIKTVLDNYNDGAVPYIKVEALKKNINKVVILDAREKEEKKNINKVVILDAREKEEYEISHLKGAFHIGFKNFNLLALDKLTENSLNELDQQIIVYCSIGVRSEIIGKKLMSHGYTNVYNLYGGLFEWVNKGGDIYKKGQTTQKVHAYSKKWGRYLTKGIKVYE